MGITQTSLVKWSKTSSPRQALLCVSDPEDGWLAGSGALEGRPPGGTAQRGNDGGTESRGDRALPRGQGKGAGDHQRVCQR